MSELSEQASGALRDALGAEHAAVWVYGLAGAYVQESRVQSAIDEALGHHRNRRDAAERSLRDAGQEPPSAQPGYAPPEPINDQKSAIRMLVTAENDCQIGWRAVLENSDDPTLRRGALDGLTAAATRAARWRLTIGEQPAAQPFPGSP
jgi:hypothetical protein